MKKLLLILLFAASSLHAQTPPANANYIQPYNAQSRIFRAQTYFQGSIFDSILVIGPYRWLSRMSINDYGFIKATYTGFDSRYQLIGNYLTAETDPSVSSFVKGITAASFNNGNTAYSWGNHQGLYYPVSNPMNFISSYTESDPLWNAQKASYLTISAATSGFKPMSYTPTYADLPDKPNLSVYYLSSNPNGYISSYTETDPIWNAQKSQYSTKAAADLLYKPISYTYTETDPIWQSVSANYRTKAQNDLIYQATGNYLTTELDPVWISARSSYSTKAVADGLYKGIGYTPSSAEVITALGYTPYSSSNPAGYITGITSAQVTTALGYTPAQPVTPSYNNAPSRALNTNYTLSATRPVRASYTVALTTTLSLLNLNSAARVYMEVSSNAGTTWQTVNSAGTSKVLTVSISIGLNETTYWNLVGEVPPNNLVRLRSVVSGGGTATFDSGQEVTM